MTKITDLLVVQAGKESARGTAVTPTVKLTGIESATITPVVDAMRINELRGTLVPGYNQVLNRVAASGNIGGVVTYEDLPYYLDSAFGEVTPSGTGPYTYAYSAPIGTAPVPRIMTIVYGDGADAYSAAGMVAKTLNISGQTGEPIKFNVDFVGTGVNSGTLASLADRAVNVALGSDVELYIDPPGTAPGTTLIPSGFFTFALNVETNRDNLFALGDLSPRDYYDRIWDGTLNLSLELDSTTKQYMDDIIGASDVFSKIVRIKVTDGTNVLQIDFSGFVQSAPELYTDNDGVVSVDLSLAGTYDAVMGNWLNIEVINGVGVLP